MKNRNYIPFPKATSKLASHYQYESLLMLECSQKFFQNVLKVYKRHHHSVSKIEDFYSGDAEKSFASDLKLLISKYRLQDNLMIPVGNFVKTLKRGHLREAPAFFRIFEADCLGEGWKQIVVEIFVEPTHAEIKVMHEELKKMFRKPHRTPVFTKQPLFGQDAYKIIDVDSIAKKRKHIGVIFTVEPTDEEMDGFAKKVSKIFKQRGFHSRKKSTESFRRNLIFYIARKRGIYPMNNKLDELIARHYANSKDTAVKSDKKRKETVRKGVNEFKKEFESRFGQTIKYKVRFRKDKEIYEMDRLRHFEVTNTEDLYAKPEDVYKKS